MKKLLIFGSIIVALFAAISFITSYQQKQAAKNNPYHKEELDPATVAQLDDPNYQNIILPDELEQKLKIKKPSPSIFTVRIVLTAKKQHLLSFLWQSKWGLT